MSVRPGDSAPALTYRDAGVDLDAAASVKLRIKELAQRTLGPAVISGPGGFGGIIDPGADSDTLLVSSTDSVGTKLRIAQALGRHDTVGVDIVNHCINDVLPAGATPLFFLDYIGISRFDQDLISQIVTGLTSACAAANCALLGGETATLPGIYHGDDYDLVGFIVGTVRRSERLAPENTRAGDVLIGLPSSGLHTNGFSLVRKVFGLDDDSSVLRDPYPGGGRPLGEALAEPHRSYLDALKPQLARIKGLAHITGGGIFKNLPRSIADGLAAEVDLGSWTPAPLFQHIQKTGGIADLEMYRVFNMGMGMVVIADESEAEALLRSLDGSWAVGRLVERQDEERVVIRGL